MKKLSTIYALAVAAMALGSIYAVSASPAALQAAPPAPEVNFGGAPPPCGPWPLPPCPPQANKAIGKKAPKEPAGK
jgi:hypothetical protein